MKINSIILLLLFSLIIFSSFMIFKLNNNLVSVDILFKEIEVRLGVLTLSAFLTGLLTCLVFELIYFYKKNKN